MDDENKPYTGPFYATIIFPWPLYKELKDESEALGISTSDHVNNLLREYRAMKEECNRHLEDSRTFMSEQREFNQALSRHLGFFFLRSAGHSPIIPRKLTFDESNPDHGTMTGEKSDDRG